MFSENLRRVMNEKNLTIKKAAELTGYCPATISRYIHGKTDPLLEKKMDMADALNVPFYELTKKGPGEPPQEYIEFLSVKRTAKILNMDEETLKQNLYEGRYPWGYSNNDPNTNLPLWFVISAKDLQKHEGVQIY